MTTQHDADPRDHGRVKAHFEASATYWDDVYGRNDVLGAIYRLRQQIALGWVDRVVVSGVRAALEIGCGNGALTLALAERGLQVTAIDTAQGMLEITRGRLAAAGLEGRVVLRQGDAHQLEHPNESFDVVVALGVLPWLHDPDRALREMSRVLRPGGSLVVTIDRRRSLTDWLDPRQSPAFAPSRGLLKRLRSNPRPTGERARERQTLPAEIDSALRTVGLQKLEGRTLGFGPFTVFSRKVFPATVNLRLNALLQRIADSGVPLPGNQYMVVARRASA